MRCTSRHRLRTAIPSPSRRHVARHRAHRRSGTGCGTSRRGKCLQRAEVVDKIPAPVPNRMRRSSTRVACPLRHLVARVGRASLTCRLGFARPAPSAGSSCCVGERGARGAHLLLPSTCARPRSSWSSVCQWLPWLAQPRHRQQTRAAACWAGAGGRRALRVCLGVCRSGIPARPLVASRT